MLTVRVLSVMLRVMPMLRVLQMMLWFMVSLVLSMAGVVWVVFGSTVPLLNMMVGVLWVVVLCVAPGVGGPWAVVGVGCCNSWLRARCVALLAGWPVSPAVAFGDVNGERAVGDVGVAGDVDIGGFARGATGVTVSDDAYGEGVDGDAPGDVLREGGVGGTPGVVVAGDVDSGGVAGDALVDGVTCVALMVRVQLVIEGFKSVRSTLCFASPAACCWCRVPAACF